MARLVSCSLVSVEAPVGSVVSMARRGIPPAVRPSLRRVRSPAARMRRTRARTWSVRAATSAIEIRTGSEGTDGGSRECLCLCLRLDFVPCLIWKRKQERACVGKLNSWDKGQMADDPFGCQLQR